MEPPAKRARHGRAPHDNFANYAMPMDYNSKNTGVKKSKTDAEWDGTENEDDEGDDEDEIAMDPEDYAMKLNPQYRIQKSRAVADNKLKSAFELLFEKYSKDFGDTGDEINFYTDEIEVDNGHITSILAEEEPEDDEDDGANDVRRNGKSAEEIGRGLSLLSTGPILTAKEPAEKATSDAKSAILDDEPVDPTWAAPTIPDDAFSTPKPPSHAVQPPRIVYSVPHRAIFRKSLPESFGKVASARSGKGAVGGRAGLGMDDNDNEDNLLMDTSEPILKFSHGKHTPRRRASNWTGLSPGPTSTVSPSLPAAPSLPLAGAVLGLPPPPSSILSTVPHPNAAAVPTSLKDSSHLSGDITEKPASAEKETFSRNIMDPSFAFSDDEDFGMKRRITNIAASKSAGAAIIANSTKETPTTEKKRGPGRPRKHPVSEKKSKSKRQSTRDTFGPVIFTTPITVSMMAPSRPPPRDPTPVSAQQQVSSLPEAAQPPPTLPPKRSIGRSRKMKAPENAASTSTAGTPTTEHINGQEVPFSSPQPRLMASTPSKPPTQEMPTNSDPQSAPQPIKRRVGRPKKIRESEGVVSTAIDTPLGQGQGTASGQGKNPAPLAGSPQSIPINLTPSKPPTQEVSESIQSAPQPGKRRVGRPKKVRDAGGDSNNNTPGAVQSSPASGPKSRPATATPTSTPSNSNSKSKSNSPAQIMSPPLWQSVTQFQQKRRVGRPRKVPTVVDDGPPPPADSQELPQLLQPSQSSQELPRPLLHLPKSPSTLKSGRTEIPDSEATIPSSNTTTASTSSRKYGLRSSLRSEIPDSDVNLSSSIITLVSDDDVDDGDGDNDKDNDSDYSVVQAAISSQLVGVAGLGGSRLSPARSQSLHRSPTHSPSRLSPTRGMATAASATPLTTARFVVIPGSGRGSPIPFGLSSGRASPLARSVLRTPSPVKFSTTKLSSGTKLFTGAGADTSPSGSVSSVQSLVQTPGGTMRRCGQDGFRCEREFCFKCA